MLSDDKILNINTETTTTHAQGYCETYLSRLADDHVLCLVLVSVGVATNHDGLDPSGYEFGDCLADDGLPKHSSAQDIPDGSVGGQPHLLQFEF